MTMHTALLLTSFLLGPRMTVPTITETVAYPIEESCQLVIEQQQSLIQVYLYYSAGNHKRHFGTVNVQLYGPTAPGQFNTWASEYEITLRDDPQHSSLAVTVRATSQTVLAELLRLLFQWRQLYDRLENRALTTAIPIIMHRLTMYNYLPFPNISKELRP